MKCDATEWMTCHRYLYSSSPQTYRNTLYVRESEGEDKSPPNSPRFNSPAEYWKISVAQIRDCSHGVPGRPLIVRLVGGVKHHAARVQPSRCITLGYRALRERDKMSGPADGDTVTVLMQYSTTTLRVGMSGRLVGGSGLKLSSL